MPRLPLPTRRHDAGRGIAHAWTPLMTTMTSRGQRVMVLVLGAMAVAAAGAAAQAEFTYSGATGPAFWGGLDPSWTACGRGGKQSPIDFGELTSRHDLHRAPVQVSYT